MLKAIAMRYAPSLLGTKNRSNSSNAYNLGYANKTNKSARSRNSVAWKGSRNYQSRADAETSSQEEIFGIKRTVDVSVSRYNGSDDDRKSPYSLDDPLASPTTGPRYLRMDPVYKKPSQYSLDDGINLPRYPGRDEPRRKPDPYALDHIV